MKARRLVHHSTLGLRVIKKKKRVSHLVLLDERGAHVEPPRLQEREHLQQVLTITWRYTPVKRCRAGTSAVVRNVNTCDGLRVGWGTTREEHARGAPTQSLISPSILTPTQSHISPGIGVYEDKRRRVWYQHCQISPPSCCFRQTESQWRLSWLSLSLFGPTNSARRGFVSAVEWTNLHHTDSILTDQNQYLYRNTCAPCRRQ